MPFKAEASPAAAGAAVAATLTRSAGGAAGPGMASPHARLQGQAPPHWYLLQLTVSLPGDSERTDHQRHYGVHFSGSASFALFSFNLGRR